MRTRQIFPSVLVLAFSVSGASGDGVYKWVDEQGNVTYSSTPPPTESDGEKLDHIEPAEEPLTEEERLAIELQRQQWRADVERYREQDARKWQARDYRQSVQQNSAEIARLRPRSTGVIPAGGFFGTNAASPT